MYLDVFLGASADQLGDQVADFARAHDHLTGGQALDLATPLRWPARRASAPSRHRCVLRGRKARVRAHRTVWPFECDGWGRTGAPRPRRGRQANAAFSVAQVHERTRRPESGMIQLVRWAIRQVRRWT